jgi:uncharacterized protein YceK
MTKFRLVLASVFIAATTLLSGCGSPSSQTSTQSTMAQPAPMTDTTTTQYRK